LTKDPYIFAKVARDNEIDGSPFVNARLINEGMHEFVADALIQQLEALGKRPSDCKILICGLAFKGKPDTGDLRNSSGVEIATLLKTKVGKIYGYDPVAEQEGIKALGIEFADLPGGFKGMDAVLFLNNHDSFLKIDVWGMMRSLNAPGIVYDAWHLFEPGDITSSCPCVYMGLGMVRSSVNVDE